VKQISSWENNICPVSQEFILVLWSDNYRVRGPGSSVGIATDYGLDGPGIESMYITECKFKVDNLSKTLSFISERKHGKCTGVRDDNGCLVGT
jgi:hypothetical protein